MKTLKLKYDKKKSEVVVEPGEEKKTKVRKVSESNDVILKINGVDVFIPEAVWNHGSGWNSITIECDD